MQIIQISVKKFALHMTVIALIALGVGFYIGYDAHSLSLANLADSYLKGDIIVIENGTVYGKTDCWERAFILSAWLPFELTEGLQVQDCQEIEWLDNKFQKLYFEPLIRDSSDPYWNDTWPSLLKQSGKTGGKHE